MTDNLTPADRRRTMQAVKGKGTRLERRLFALLASMGLSGWRQNASDIIGKPDVVFPSLRVAIFIDGCFWHGCPTCKRPLPATNRAYWQRKIKRNITLAKSHNRALRRSGWTVLRIWEHDISNTDAIRIRIIKALQPKGR